MTKTQSQSCTMQEKGTKTIIHSLNMGMTGASSYLLESPGGMILVDTGFPNQEKVVMKKLAALNRADLNLIFLTHAHFDHFGSAKKIQELTKAPIAIHTSDVALLAQGDTPLGKVRSWGKFAQWVFLPLAYKIWKPQGMVADISLTDGDSLLEYGINAHIIHTPGHTPGSSCLLIDDNIILAGDLILSHPTVYVQQFFAFDWPLVAKSFYKIRDLNPSKVYCGHGKRILDRKALMKLKPVRS